MRAKWRHFSGDFPSKKGPVKQAVVKQAAQLKKKPQKEEKPVALKPKGPKVSKAFEGGSPGVAGGHSKKKYNKVNPTKVLPFAKSTCTRKLKTYMYM